MSFDHFSFRGPPLRAPPLNIAGQHVRPSRNLIKAPNNGSRELTRLVTEGSFLACERPLESKVTPRSSSEYFKVVPYRRVVVRTNGPPRDQSRTVAFQSGETKKNHRWEISRFHDNGKEFSSLLIVL